MVENQWIADNPYPKQQQFLLLSDIREVFYGGAGGGGKSQALWYGALQYVHVPRYAALILRRRYTDLSLPSSLMNRSKALLAGTAAKWHEQTKTWSFPDGGTITFGYLENDGDKFRYASAEFQYIAFDELTHFKEDQYTFLFSRLRRNLSMPVPPRMRSASNPGSIGHDWVKRRFIDPETRDPDTVFIPASIADNPGMDRDDYRRSLRHLDPLTRQQIEDGNWDAAPGGRFKRDWFRYWRQQGDYIECGDDRYDFRTSRVFLTVDPAASSSDVADYTVISVWNQTPRGDLVWLDCIRVRKEIPDIVPLIQQQVLRWKPSTVGIESVMSNTAVLQLALRAKNPSIPARPLNPMGRDKLVRATAAMNFAAMGRIWLPARVGQFPMDAVMGELLRFTGNEKEDAHDDIVDSLSYAVEMMTTMPTLEEGRVGPKVFGGR